MDNILKFHHHLKGNYLDTEKLKECAEELMGRYCIKKKDAYYQIAEIEFYYYGPKHPDIITYPRTCSEKQWFFHQSGVDLTITSDKKGDQPSFGGILIRSIIKYDRNGNIIRTICGPQKCVEELFDILDAVDYGNNLTPLLVETTKFGDAEVCSSQRYITFNVTTQELKGDNDEQDNYKKAIKSKANTKYDNILADYKRLVSNDLDKLKNEVIPFERFCDYLKAKYRFFLKETEWQKGYRASKICSDQNRYKYLLT